MASVLPQLDVTVANYSQFRSPVSSPVRSFASPNLRDPMMDSPSNPEFVEWKPGMQAVPDIFAELGDAATSVGSASLPTTPILRLAEDDIVASPDFEEWQPGLVCSNEVPKLDLNSLENEWTATAGNE